MSDKDDKNPMSYFVKKKPELPTFHRSDDNVTWGPSDGDNITFNDEVTDVTNPSFNEGYVGTSSITIDPIFQCDDTPQQLPKDVAKFPRTIEDIKYNKAHGRKTKHLPEEMRVQAELWPNVFDIKDGKRVYNVDRVKEKS